mmetsp:Transcript_32225/g.76555  ORF Transcript_32225/g.76555 Transcript_32225/m.76555 type:complete len:438 (+) Transcript_32225:8094-9407(+)
MRGGGCDVSGACVQVLARRCYPRAGDCGRDVHLGERGALHPPVQRRHGLQQNLRHHVHGPGRHMLRRDLRAAVCQRQGVHRKARHGGVHLPSPSDVHVVLAGRREHRGQHQRHGGRHAVRRARSAVHVRPDQGGRAARELDARDMHGAAAHLRGCGRGVHGLLVEQRRLLRARRRRRPDAVPVHVRDIADSDAVLLPRLDEHPQHLPPLGMAQWRHAGARARDGFHELRAEAVDLLRWELWDACDPRACDDCQQHRAQGIGAGVAHEPRSDRTAEVRGRQGLPGASLLEQRNVHHPADGAQVSAERRRREPARGLLGPLRAVHVVRAARNHEDQVADLGVLRGALAADVQGPQRLQGPAAGACVGRDHRLDHRDRIHIVVADPATGRQRRDAQRVQRRDEAVHDDVQAPLRAHHPGLAVLLPVHQPQKIERADQLQP